LTFNLNVLPELNFVELWNGHQIEDQPREELGIV